MYDLSVSHSVEPAALQSAIATTAVPAALFGGFKPQPSPTTPTVHTHTMTYTYTTPHRHHNAHTHSRPLHTLTSRQRAFSAGGDVRPLLLWLYTHYG